MVEWKFLNNQNMIDNWDMELYHFSEANYFQSTAWAKYKYNYGWETYRFIAFDNKDKIISLAQMLVRKYPLSNCIAWCPGGPIGDISTINKNFINFCVKTFGCKRTYLRISPRIECEDSKKTEIISNGWKIPKHKLTSGLSMVIDLSLDKDMLLNNLSKNWKRNLKRFKEDQLTISKWDNPNIETIINLYSKMELYKNIQQQHTTDTLSNLFKYLGSNIILFRCDHNNELVAIRAAFIHNNKGWDLLAATDQIARKYYGSHRLFWNLLMYCKTHGVKNFDLGGIHPKSGEGVYNFKKGTGAKHITYLGEREWATSSIINFIVNNGLKYKQQTF